MYEVQPDINFCLKTLEAGLALQLLHNLSYLLILL